MTTFIFHQYPPIDLFKCHELSDGAFKVALKIYKRLHFNSKFTKNTIVMDRMISNGCSYDINGSHVVINNGDLIIISQ